MHPFVWLFGPWLTWLNDEEPMPDDDKKVTISDAPISAEEAIANRENGLKRRKLPTSNGRDCPNCGTQLFAKFAKLGTVRQCLKCLHWCIVG